MRKNISLHFVIIIFLMSCLNNTTNSNKTIADLAGTYEGYNCFLIIKKDGEIQFIDIYKRSYKTKVDSSLPEFSFYVNDFNVSLTDKINIDDVKLNKISDSEVFFTTVEDRVGTYNCKNSENNNLILIITEEGNVSISGNVFDSLDVLSIEKVFVVLEYPIAFSEYEIDFEKNKLTGVKGNNAGKIFIMTKM